MAKELDAWLKIEHIPLIRRQDVKGFVQRKPVWLVRPLGLETGRNEASAIGAPVFATGVLIGSS